ncbi:hypothetical protein QBC36DRAFT_326629 [Triangularia setosa]|uniref:Uncharacterized protein n=1 Tax=Triangularia setosa TaxID=2587417 RepID=A0AAN6W9B2_9PEZI|nr:hypothetical protein QBC36DRAFT_326629 [Podospora setosa]
MLFGQWAKQGSCKEVLLQLRFRSLVVTGIETSSLLLWLVSCFGSVFIPSESFGVYLLSFWDTLIVSSSFSSLLFRCLFFWDGYF